MQPVNVPRIQVENTSLTSGYLQREVKIDFFLPEIIMDPTAINLLLINDGQNMEELGLKMILSKLCAEKAIRPLLCAAIHTNKERKKEYGVSGQPDYMGWGAKAGLYTSFIMDELISFIRNKYAINLFCEKAFAGFSLGGLSALDIVWNHPGEFSKVGVFSGSLWWRNIDQAEEHYDDHKHRIMHQMIRNGQYHPGLNFFFQCGNMDETMDRNNNGIIDSIDDTLDLVKELEAKGYSRGKDIQYLEMPDGKHDIPTWGRVMPEFLKWGFSL